jgi:hypothetical protein
LWPSPGPPGRHLPPPDRASTAAASCRLPPRCTPSGQVPRLRPGVAAPYSPATDATRSPPLLETDALKAMKKRSAADRTIPVGSPPCLPYKRKPKPRRPPRVSFSHLAPLLIALCITPSNSTPLPPFLIADRPTPCLLRPFWLPVRTPETRYPFPLCHSVPPCLGAAVRHSSSEPPSWPLSSVHRGQALPAVHEAWTEYTTISI